MAAIIYPVTKCVNIGILSCMSEVQCKAILFDLDGTLVDTIGDIAFAVNSVLSHVGAPPIDKETCKAYVGRGLRNALSLALGTANVPFDDSYLDILMHTYREHPYDRAIVYPGIRRLLEKSVADGLPLGVLSNKEDSLVQRIVHALLGDIPFIHVQGALDGIPLKPDPSSALQFAEKANCRAREVMLVGDSEVDHRTALAANMRPAVVTWGFRNKKSLLSSGCQPLYDYPQELEMEVGSWH